MVRLLQRLFILCLLFAPLLAQAQLERLKKFKNAGLGVTETTMIEIPAGEFLMGLDGVHALEDERPAHRVWLATFVIDQYEVTTAQYAEFFNSEDRDPPWQWEAVEFSRHSDRPVIGVSWHDAESYCRWKGKRLPTEAEWEKAARGTDGRSYPWGSQAPTNERANFALGARFSYDLVLAPVQSHPQGRSPFALHHMAGNVYEWVQDWYAIDYYDSSPDRNPTGPVKGQFKVVRGGSWSDLPKYLLTYGRFKLSPDTRNSYTGFRCARSLAQ